MWWMLSLVPRSEAMMEDSSGDRLSVGADVVLVY